MADHYEGVTLSSDFTPDELADIVLLQAKRSWQESTTQCPPADRKIVGRGADTLLVYLLTSTETPFAPYGAWELEPALNLYMLMPPWMQARVEPLIIKWRLKIYKDPDFAEQSIV